MRLIIELASIMYVLILVYLVLSHGRESTNILSTTFRGTTGLVRVLQGRG